MLRPGSSRRSGWRLRRVGLESFINERDLFCEQFKTIKLFSDKKRDAKMLANFTKACLAVSAFKQF
jgi:hypothetical protein